MKDTSVVWFRNDLRLHDNEALVKATQGSDNVIPVYIFDPRIFNGKTKFGFRKTGYYRAKFILESVKNLKEKLVAVGSDLYIRIGKPEIEVAKIANEYKASWVFCNRERTYEEEKVQDRLEQNLWETGLELFYTRGKMLYYTTDLPFPVKHTPDLFTNFRKEIEKIVQVRDPLPAPTQINNQYASEIEWGSVPSLKDLGYHEQASNSCFIGGEDAGLKQLNDYIWEKDLLKSYKETRNGSLGWDYSSKLSPWLAVGALSPKTIYSEVKKYEATRVSNESTYWLVFELLWRDYFRLIGKKYGNKIFQKSGIKNINYKASEDIKTFERWASGRTGVAYIDAHMKELNETGFMSNRGRQNVASFLINDLKINWLMGAEYFESLLIDYDPCSNYLNWNYLAGVGTDAREDRYFNTITQSKKYDQNGDYVRHWLPQLAAVPNEYIHNIGSLSDAQLASYGVKIDQDFPRAIVKLKEY